MAQCVSFIRGTDRCQNEARTGYKFCEEHSKRPNAIKEREERTLGEVIDATEAFTQQNDDEDKPSAEIAREEEATNKEARIPLNQKNIYEKTTEALDRMIEWEGKTFERMAGLSPEEWRYTDKAGAEQLRAELGLYERAQDRVLRGVTAVAKLDIDAASVNANKMLRQMIKVCVTNTLVRMGMAPHEIEQARQILTEEFEKAAGQAS